MEAYAQGEAGWHVSEIHTGDEKLNVQQNH